MIVRELSLVDMRTDGSKVLMLDDPELFKYPIAFMWEPGFWNLTDEEASAFRAYLTKGGFGCSRTSTGPSSGPISKRRCGGSCRKGD
jgi:hypothetical protein